MDRSSGPELEALTFRAFSPGMDMAEDGHDLSPRLVVYPGLHVPVLPHGGSSMGKQNLAAGSAMHSSPYPHTHLLPHVVVHLR